MRKKLIAFAIFSMLTFGFGMQTSQAAICDYNIESNLAAGKTTCMIFDFSSEDDPDTCEKICIESGGESVSFAEAGCVSRGGRSRVGVRMACIPKEEEKETETLPEEVNNNEGEVEVENSVAKTQETYSPPTETQTSSTKSMGVGILEATREAGFQITCPEGVANCDGDYSQGETKNFILKIIAYVLNFAAAIAVVMIVVSGIRYVVGMGNQEAIQSAQKNLLWSVGGLAIIIVSLLLVNNIGKAVSDSVGEASTNKAKATKSIESSLEEASSLKYAETGSILDGSGEIASTTEAEVSGDVGLDLDLSDDESDVLHLGDLMEETPSYTPPEIPKVENNYEGVTYDAYESPEIPIVENNYEGVTYSPSEYGGSASSYTGSARVCVGNTLSSEALTSCEENGYKVSDGLCLGSLIKEDPCSNIRGEYSKLCFVAPADTSTQTNEEGDSQTSTTINIEEANYDRWEYCKYGCENARCITPTTTHSTSRSTTTYTKTSLLDTGKYKQNYTIGGGGNVNNNYAGITYIGDRENEFAASFYTPEELQAMQASYSSDDYSPFSQNGDYIAKVDTNAEGKPTFNYETSIAMKPTQLSSEGPKEIFLVSSLLTLGILGLIKRKKLPA